MMKVLLMVFLLFFIINLINQNIMQFIYQNYLMVIMFLMMMSFPLNNLNYWIKISYIIGGDFYSNLMIYLTLWILILMNLISSMKLNLYYFNIMNLLLLFLMLCFLSFNLIMFYMFFEMSLIPVLMLIMGWGFQIDRIQAGIYMMLYTLFGSLPLFILIIYFYQIIESLMMDFLKMNIFIWYMYIMMMIAFLIKLPMYLFHLWLPKAHVEAPLSGSMILAGVMLKLGSYGMMRLMIMFLNLMMNFNKFIMIISLLGGIYSSLICLNQMDMKKLVAYSSIVHMSILMNGLMTLNNWGFSGGLLMMLGHGLCSSGMFCLVNINYERLHSRSLLINKGMINYYPSLSMMWFLLCSSNLSFPPSLNLWSEIMLLNSIIIWNKMMILLLMMLLFLSASYSLYLYSFSQHGLIKLHMYIKNINIKGIFKLNYTLITFKYIFYLYKYIYL
uniref:NADH-ubiquinone oxidoreductase chain 4 n=1 Tax=Diadromus collaris TaxID=7421 RepID=U5HTG4_9HYME|nr:NADH dehydrogenase subunit 4 [Diadromus collaris]